MYNHSKDLALFLEQMRVSRGISQEEFTEGIISNRQYQRYINGSSAMPFHLLDEFAERLNVKKDFLLLEFDSYGIKETNNVMAFFNAVNNSEMDEAKKIQDEISPKFIMDSSNLKFYQYAQLILKFKEKKTTLEMHIRNCKQLIDYPKILNSPAMTMVETIILSDLLDFTIDEKEQLKIFNKITAFINNPSLVWTGSQILTYNLLMFKVAKYSGLKKDFDNVIHFCNIAIKLNYKSKYFLNLDFYYYFLALAYHRKNMMSLYEENLYQCYTALEMMKSSDKTANIRAMAKKDFDVDLIDFAIEYQKRKYKSKGSS